MIEVPTLAAKSHEEFFISLLNIASLRNQETKPFASNPLNNSLLAYYLDFGQNGFRAVEAILHVPCPPYIVVYRQSTTMCRWSMDARFGKNRVRYDLSKVQSINHNVDFKEEG